MTPNLIHGQGIRKFLQILIKNLETEEDISSIASKLRHLTELLKKPEIFSSEYEMGTGWYSNMLNELKNLGYFNTENDLIQNLTKLLRAVGSEESVLKLDFLEKTNRLNLKNVYNLIEEQFIILSKALDVIAEREGKKAEDLKKTGIEITPIKDLGLSLFSKSEDEMENIVIRGKYVQYFRPEISLVCSKCRTPIKLKKNQSSHKIKRTKNTCSMRLIVKDRMIFCDECGKPAIMENGTCSGCQKLLFHIFPILRILVTDNNVRMTTENVYYDFSKFSAKEIPKAKKIQTMLDQGNVVVKINKANILEFLKIPVRTAISLYFNNQKLLIDYLKKQLGNWYYLRGVPIRDFHRSQVVFVPRVGGISGIGHEIDDKSREQKIIQMVKNLGYEVHKKSSIL